MKKQIQYYTKNYLLILLLFIAIDVKAEQNDTSTTVKTVVAATTDFKGDTAVINYLSSLNIPTTNNNKIKLLKSGEEKFADMFAAIRDAKHYVYLEYFNFRNDSIGWALFNLLIEKVNEGVIVRALCDGFGNWSNGQPLKDEHFEMLREKGVDILVYDKVYFPYIQHTTRRDHRKIVIVDGKIAYTGGMNVADYYIVGRPDIGDWHDMHMRIEGSAVEQLQDIFITFWEKNSEKKLDTCEYYRVSQDTTDESYDKLVAIVDRTPRKTPKNMRNVYAKSIASAQEIVQIVNPYFLPPKNIKKELKNALKRGVEVMILFSSKADVKFTPEGSLYAAYQLVKKGAKVYLYNGGFHHSKIMMIDHLFCTVGTSNLDSRSMRFDYEVNTFIFDKEITNELCEVFNSDENCCTQLTKEVWKKRSIWKRFVGWFAYTLTPVM